MQLNVGYILFYTLTLQSVQIHVFFIRAKPYKNSMSRRIKNRYMVRLCMFKIPIIFNSPTLQSLKGGSRRQLVYLNHCDGVQSNYLNTFIRQQISTYHTDSSRSALCFYLYNVLIKKAHPDKHIWHSNMAAFWNVKCYMYIRFIWNVIVVLLYNHW